ncbi:putative ORFan [Tupanvirus deep ocean]|uniref:ORFan n=2 Tax=Tupanvirus TaxID=2094720 RepID=A0AC62A720_9VIRU|nr:putative ORFan [Tupanvirus deep ocean]QKU33478.1 putative ORFan [Tupanvirus deep ocean]
MQAAARISSNLGSRFTTSRILPDEVYRHPPFPFPCPWRKPLWPWEWPKPYPRPYPWYYCNRHGCRCVCHYSIQPLHALIK